MNNFDFWSLEDKINDIKTTEFIGFNLSTTNAKVLKSFDIDGTEFIIITDKTVFFPRGGGQTSDIGIVKSKEVNYNVTEVRKVNDIIMHRVTGNINTLTTEEVELNIDEINRFKLEQNHSSTHILWKCIENILGFEMKQAYEMITPEEVNIEMIDESSSGLLNEDVIKQAVEAFHKLSSDDVKSNIFYENDDPMKRTVEFKGIVKEYCGGTHLKTTLDLPQIEIIKFKKKSNKYKIGFIQK